MNDISEPDVYIPLGELIQQFADLTKDTNSQRHPLELIQWVLCCVDDIPNYRTQEQLERFYSRIKQTCIQMELPPDSINNISDTLFEIAMTVNETITQIGISFKDRYPLLAHVYPDEIKISVRRFPPLEDLTHDTNYIDDIQGEHRQTPR